MAALDMIGDIHGYALALEALLRKMGYSERAGAWRHPERKAVFVGDLIDRGPEQLRTIDIVRRMVDAGSARCLMGNHEYNAIGWHTPDPWHPGEYLRRHNHDRRQHHHAFLAELDGKPELHDEIVDWFRTLPLWLEIDGCRVIHACWDERHMEVLRPHLSPDGSLDRDVLERSMPKSAHPEHLAIEVLLKGPEAALPHGLSVPDWDGTHRREVRLAWWRKSPSLRAWALPMPDLDIGDLADDPLPARLVPRIGEGGPVFFGHYWMSGPPQTLGDGLACLDYGAGRGAPVVAYRWDGDPRLDPARFVTSAGRGVPRRPVGQL